ncbi:MAG: hypothetical protein ABSA18_09635 [Dehalococcoidia bacterium]
MVSLLLGLLPSICCASNQDIDKELNPIINQYSFSIATWEIKAIAQSLGQHIRSSDKDISGREDLVAKYLTLRDHIKALNAATNATNMEKLQPEINDLERQQETLASSVEKIIDQQIREALEEQGIYQPWYKDIGLKINFPQVDIKVETPPHLLVISPRNKIETIKTVLLNEDLSLDSMNAIEANADKLNVSSLVVDLGGLGTYPSIVASDADLHFILETAAHEWTHEYLAFKPLGFLYLLEIAGIVHNPDIVTMNETVADTVGKEIGEIVYQKYYAGVETNSPRSVSDPAFDFDHEMRDIRKSVDQYLARGEVDTAENFMREKRDFLATKGYYIRKLNQAYFAFNGEYADRTAFISPIGMELNDLRTKSFSLEDFLNTAASMTSWQDLKLALDQR